MDSLQLRTKKFNTGIWAKIASVPRDVDINYLKKTLELGDPRALLIINGGTLPFEEKIESRLRILFKKLSILLVKEKITILTGGTNKGIFSILGNELSKLGGPTAACVGVTVSGKISIHDLEPHHTHFVLVEGSKWGDETALMYNIAESLSAKCQSLAIFAGGGEVTIAEMMENVQQRREMVFITGSKGSTDIAATLQLSKFLPGDRFYKIIQNGKITIFSIDEQADTFCSLIRDRLLNQKKQFNSGNRDEY